MVRPLLMLALLALPVIGPVAAAAQDRQAETGRPPERVRSVTLRPGERCPPSTSTDVVVCGTLDEPYRIPKNLRDEGPVPAQDQAWSNRAATVDEISRMAGGLPDTCSAVGAGGQSGCSAQAARQWVAEKAEQRRQASVVP